MTGWRGHNHPRVPNDPVHEHFERLRESAPTLTLTHLSRLAGLAQSTLSRPRGEYVTPDTVERVLAVTARHVALLPPYRVPSDAVARHVEALTQQPGVSRALIAKVAGISYQTLYNIPAGHTRTVTYATHTSVLAVTAAHVRDKVFRRDPRPTITRIRALEVNDWSQAAMSEVMGLNVVDVLQAREWVYPSVEARVKAGYDAIGDTPGPGNPRTKRRAIEAGYLPPWHYDDDMHQVEVDAGPDEEARLRLCVLGMTLLNIAPREIALHLGVEQENVAKWRERVGLRYDGHEHRLRPGQEQVVARVREALDGIAWTERIAALDEPGIDYAERWAQARTARVWRRKVAA